MYINKSNNWLSFFCCELLPGVYHTDKNGFKKLLKNIEITDSELCFLTARENSKQNKRFTKIDFNNIGVNYDDYIVYHCGKIPKGEYIKNSINYEFFNDVIFIDDLDKNIDSVKTLFGSKIKCYKFIVNK